MILRNGYLSGGKSGARAAVSWLLVRGFHDEFMTDAPFVPSKRETGPAMADPVHDRPTKTQPATRYLTGRAFNPCSYLMATGYIGAG